MLVSGIGGASTARSHWRCLYTSLAPMGIQVRGLPEESFGGLLERMLYRVREVV